MTEGNVSIIIVNWNAGRFIERCLHALLAQTVKPREIIVVDNASSDGSAALVQQFPDARLIALNENTGFARGNNIGIASVSGKSEWIALINPDAFAEPAWLEKLLQAAAANPEYDVFGSKLINANTPSLLDGAGDAYHISGLAWRTGHGWALPGRAEKAHEIFSPCAAAALYRRSAMDKAQGFDEDFFCYMEDVDLGFRLRLIGHRCLYVPESAAYHIGSGTTGGQRSDFAIYHGHRNLVWVFVKNMPGLLFWPLLPLHIMLNLVSLLWFTLRGQGKVICRAKRDALLGIPIMWRKRRLVQRARITSVADIWQQLSKAIIKK